MCTDLESCEVHDKVNLLLRIFFGPHVHNRENEAHSGKRHAGEEPHHLPTAGKNLGFVIVKLALPSFSAVFQCDGDEILFCGACYVWRYASSSQAATRRKRSAGRGSRREC
eukprot:SAG11_NODE_6129_length_1382_cov_1.990647_2_plen_111_part_00